METRTKLMIPPLCNHVVVRDVTLALSSCTQAGYILHTNINTLCTSLIHKAKMRASTKSYAAMPFLGIHTQEYKHHAMPHISTQTSAESLTFTSSQAPTSKCDPGSPSKESPSTSPPPPHPAAAQPSAPHCPRPDSSPRRQTPSSPRASDPQS
jgi:hypothetical protein